VGDVLAALGLLDGDQPVCPGCRESDGSSVAIVKNGLKCSHDRCSGKGYAAGFRTTIDIVQEAQGLDAPGALGWLRETFPDAGIEPPHAPRKASPAPKKHAPRPAQTSKAPENDQEHAPAGAHDWQAELKIDRHGPRKNLHNVALILSRDDGWPGCLAYDEFADRLTLLQRPPSHEGLRGEAFPRAWRDTDDGLVALWLQKTWDIEAGPELVALAATTVACRNRIHPVREYLESVTWDGKPRLATWLHDYLGARQTAYSAAVGACALRASVARIFRPGCKADTMLVLQGGQGTYKSSALRVLYSPRFFTDDLADFGSKDAAMQLRGAWCIEVAELAGLGRAEVERVKAFISRAVERYRSAYGRHVQEQPRQCVFIGTTNADTYLKDETGNRRFWPIACGAVGPIDRDGLARDRDQLWAEAVAEFRSGARWHLDPIEDAAALKQATAAQEHVRERDAWEALIQRYISKEQPVFVTTGDLLNRVGVDPSRWGVSEQRRAGAIIRGLGWIRRQRGGAGEKEWGYTAPYLAGNTPGTDAPPPGTDGRGAPGGIGATGGGITAENGSGTDGTERTGVFLECPTHTPPAPDAPPLASERAASCRPSETIGSIGAIGAYSENQQASASPMAPMQAPGTDAPPAGASPPPPPATPSPTGAPLGAAALARMNTDKLTDLIRSLPPGAPEASAVLAEADYRLAHDGPKCPVPTSPEWDDLVAAVAAVAASRPSPLDAPAELEELFFPVASPEGQT
jgi:predicted P-loop ATPase